jgi:ferric-dicitrate binding protein FerR (iron transport regulator)
VTGSDRKFETVEDLIFDSDFIELSERNNPDEIDQFLLSYPDKQGVVCDALLLLQYLNIEEREVTDIQIEEDWRKIQGRIDAEKRTKKNVRLYLWSAAAACAVALMVLFWSPASQPSGGIDEKDNLFSLMESADISGSEVRIIAGNRQADIENNETIVQGEDGNVIVGNNRKLESSDIEAEYLTVVVPKGRRTTIKFSDGTTAWINSGSKVVYPKTFAVAKREIIVDGEVYLDVTNDQTKPFAVRTARGFEVQVLGTKFNVNAYSGDADNSVVLVEGSVEIITDRSKGKLFPNQGFFVKEGSYSIKNVDVYPYICWKDEVMRLDGESLNTILKRLSRHYGIDIQVGEKYTNEKYKGKIDLKEPVETVLNNISVSTPMSYTRNGDIIVIN